MKEPQFSLTHPIDEMCFQFFKQLLEGELLELQIPKFVEASRDEISSDIDFAETNSDSSQWVSRKLTSTNSTRKYTQFMALAALVAELTAGNRTMLMRDVYYSLKHLFSTQEECNRCVLELGRYLRLKRFEMNIVPSAKGYIAGPLAFSLNKSEWIVCERGSAKHGTLIDARWTSTAISAVETRILHPAVRHIVVIEKESIFHRLLEDDFFGKIPCIFVTACGYPDVATRALVHKLLALYPMLTAVGLCDYNPHGMALLMSFRYPPAATAFEAREYCSDLKWIGLRSRHVQNLLGLSPDFEGVLQPLTKDDHAKLRNLLNNPFLTNHLELRAEIATMLEGGTKCELEAMYLLGLEVVSQFLEAAIRSEDFV